MQLDDAIKLAQDTLKKFPTLSAWHIGIDRAVRRAGQCQYRKKCISLSKNYIEHNDVADVNNTILHEIAHALTPGAKHGQQWKNMARLIGARPERCYREHIVMPKGRWSATCGGCNRTFQRHRRPKHLSGHYCTKCGPTLGNITFKANLQPS